MKTLAVQAANGTYDSVARANIDMERQELLGAVSYTHLDVYKRQVYIWINIHKNLLPFMDESIISQTKPDVLPE